MTDAELIQALEHLRNTMVAVATGGPRIADANDEFQRNYAVARRAVIELVPPI